MIWLSCLKKLMTGGYIDEAVEQYDFTDFGDATTCCDLIERAFQIGNMVKAVGYGSALSGVLQYAHSQGVVNDKYIIKIYRYCRGMEYEDLTEALESTMAILDIDY